LSRNKFPTGVIQYSLKSRDLWSLVEQLESLGSGLHSRAAIERGMRLLMLVKNLLTDHFGLRFAAALASWHHIGH